MTAAVHQLVSYLRPGDALSAHALGVRALLRSQGFGSDLFVEGADESVAGSTRPAAELPDETGRGVAVIYQMAIGATAADLYRRCRGPRILNFHNITPPEHFRIWDPRQARALAEGRRQLADLAGVTDLAVGVSRFNAGELEHAGYRRVTVAPPLVDLSVDEPERVARDRLVGAKGGGGSDWLFVGRVVPHKGAHDLVRALAVYREAWDPSARLWLVGGEGPRRYVEAVRSLVERLGLEDAVTLTGSVSSGELAAHYEAADVFVCVSEHEGFCIPLLEALHHGLPVVALAAAAVPETLAGAGVVVGEKDPVTVAAAVRRVVEDAGLRARLAAAGAARLADFDLDTSRTRMLDALAPVLGPVGAHP